MYARTSHSHVVASSTSPFLMVRDGMKFELDKKEYFVGLASLLEVLTQMLQRCYEMQKPPTAHHLEILHALQEELIFLQDTYRIVDKK